jgi:AraC-like DNA-binding protein
MLKDEFKERYTTIPFAIYQAYCEKNVKEVITHYHREIELIAMTEGSAEFYINSRCYPVKKGDILIIPPYALHRGRTTENEVSSYDCICLDLQLLCDENLKTGLESQAFSVISMISNESPCAEPLQDHIKKAVLACKRNEIGWELEAIGNISLLFGILKKNHFISQNLQSNKESEFGRKVMSYLLEKVSDPITSRDAANELYMNHSYFCRLFKKTFGCSFEKYLLIYRLEKARLYLTTTTLTVTEIAFRLGFHSCSYFGKTFKERFHTTPLSYKKKAEQ